MQKIPMRAKLPLSLFLILLLMGIIPLSPKVLLSFDQPQDSGHNTTNLLPNPSPTPTSNPNQPKGGEPITLSTGDFVYEYQDLFIPGRIPLEIKRVYHSQDKYNGPLGYGWNFNYNIRLFETTDEKHNYVIIRRGADNVRLQFIDNGDGTFAPPPGRSLSLNHSGNSYTLRERNGLQYNFDGDGALTSIVNRHGNQLSLSYDANGMLFSATDGSNRNISFSYGSNKKIQSITDPAGRKINFRYDANDNLIEVTNPAGYKTRYAYDADHNLLSITDARNFTYLSNTYDNQDRVVSQFFNGGIFTFSYDTTNGLSTLTDRKGMKSQHYMNSSGNPVRIIRDAESGKLNLTTIKTYDQDMNLISETDPNGNTTNYTYDSAGNILTVTDAQGNVTSFTYEPSYNMTTSVTDPLGRVTTFEYDSGGNLIKATDALGNVTSLTYNAMGDLLTITNALSDITRFSYDVHGNEIITTNALGYSVKSAYDILGNLVSFTDQRRNDSHYAYDLLSRPVQVTDASGNTRKFTYDENGNETSITDELNNASFFTYDAYDQLIAAIDAMGNRSSFTYDANGDRVTFMDAEGNATINTYDALGRLIKVTDASGNMVEFAFDNNGNRVNIKDAKGNTTLNAYDSLDRLPRTVYPDGSREEYSYDKAGNLKSRKLRSGDIITYDYDALNRVKVIAYPDASTVNYTYDALGRVTSITAPGGNISYSYNSLHQVRQATQNGKTISYEYDEAGNRIKITYPEGDFIVHEYDSLHRVDKIKMSNGQVIADYTYDNLGRRNQLDLLNGNKLFYTYDGVSGVLGLTNKTSTGTVGSSFAYTYDRAGNRLTMTTSKGIHNYTYDKIYQLTNVNYPFGFQFSSASYNYDPAGNRTSVVKGGNTIPYASNTANQYSGVGGTVHTYDANGNLTSNGVNSYAYDYENKLISASTPDHPNISYKYDALGRRIEKNVAGSVTKYVYDGERVIAEYDGAGTLLRKYIYGNRLDEPLVMVTGAAEYYYQYDGLGSVSEITDGSGNIIEAYVYDVYGRASIHDGLTNQVISVSSIGNRFMFTAREYDPETGLYYYRARYYDPEIGRFLQIDPAGYDERANLYSYVGNNPVNWIDPLGLYSFDDALTDGSNFSAGFGDTLTSGFGIAYIFGLPSLTEHIRQKMGTDDVVNKCAGFYKGGQVAGHVWGIVAVPAASLNAGGRTVLYSGKGALEVARAGRGAGILLENTFGGKALNLLNDAIIRFGGKGLPNSVWKAASGIFAANAKGEVVIFLRNPALTSIYNTVERPVLLFFKNTITIFK